MRHENVQRNNYVLIIICFFYPAPPRDCYDLLHMYNMATSGVYYVYPNISAEAFIPVVVWCDMETDGGGWTVSRNRTMSLAVFAIIHLRDELRSNPVLFNMCVRSLCSIICSQSSLSQLFRL